ncbi:MAG: hypothetical protein ACK5MP_00120 [Nostocoides sp.]
MSRYEGRHAARHAGPSRSRLASAKALATPAVGGSFAIALIAAGAAAATNPTSTARSESAAAALTMTPAAADQAKAQADQQVADAKRLVSARNDALTAQNAAAGKAQEAARVRAEKLAKERAAAKARAAREAQRKQLIANAVSDPQGAARAMLPEFGFSDSQFSCLVTLWNGESRWNYKATNPYSGAGGIPQALPASKMASAGADWQTNPVTQIRWGLGYIKSRYGTPCNALGAWQSRSPHWY